MLFKLTMLCHSYVTSKMTEQFTIRNMYRIITVLKADDLAFLFHHWFDSCIWKMLIHVSPKATSSKSKSHKAMADSKWMSPLRKFASTESWPAGEGNRPAPRQKKWHQLYQREWVYAWHNVLYLLLFIQYILLIITCQMQDRDWFLCVNWHILSKLSDFFNYTFFYVYLN